MKPYFLNTQTIDLEQKKSAFENAYSELFDPELYPDMVKFQGEPGCYINENDQEMRKMTLQEEKEFWGSLPLKQKQMIEKQRREALEQIRE